EQVWDQTAPAGWVPSPRSASFRTTPETGPGAELRADPFRVAHQFEVAIPERLVAAKIRGFVEDVDATVLASEPGLIRLRVGLPCEYQKALVTGTTSLFSRWLTSLRKPPTAVGQEPIDIELQLEKPDPSVTRLCVVAAYRPMKEYPPKD